MTGLSPVDSLSMIYLREYARYAVTQRGMVRVSRKAMHMLRMHWSACAQDARSGAYVVRRATETDSEGQDTREGKSAPQIVHPQGATA